MTEKKYRPCYGGVNIYRDKSNDDPNFDEDLQPTPFHDHTTQVQQSHSDMSDADLNDVETTNENNDNTSFASNFASFVGEQSSEQVQATKRLPAAARVHEVKCYSTHIHFWKSMGSRDNLQKYRTVNQIDTLSGMVSRLIDPEGHDMFHNNFSHRVEMTCDLGHDFDLSNPSPLWFSDVLPVLQKLKNQLRLLPMCNEDILADITAMHYWLATPGNDHLFPEPLRHHNPFFGWGKNNDRRHTGGKNNITEIGRNLVALYLNTAGYWSEKYGRMFGTEFHGALMVSPTVITNEEGLIVRGEYKVPSHFSFEICFESKLLTDSYLC